MPRPIDTNISNINPQIRGAAETAAQLKIDKKVLENVEKLIGAKGLGSPEQLAKLLGPEVLSYFRAMSESLSNLCSRMQEAEVKSLPAQHHEPKFDEFSQRDTSKGPLYQERLPENFLTVEKLNLAAKTGLLTQQQAEALKNLFGLSQEARVMRREEVPMPQASPQSEQERERGGQQQRHQQEQQHSEEEAWADFSTQNSSSGNVSGAEPYYSQELPQGGGTGSFGGGSLRSGMRMGIGGGTQGGMAAPPPPPPPGGNRSSQGSGPSSGQAPNLTGMEQSYLDSNFTPDGPYYGMFESLFGSENWYRNLAGNALTNIQKIREAKQRILAALAGLDPSKPGDAKQLYILQQKLGDMQQSERQWLDNISSAQKANNERKEYIKSILDIFFQTNSAIIRNLRQ